MSFSSIKVGVFTTLIACGPFSPDQISTCDFGILESTSVCAVLFFPGQNTNTQAQAYGTPPRRDYLMDWDIDIRGYIKYDGNAPCLLARVWQMHDDLYDTIKSDDTLGGTACAAQLMRLSYNADVLYSAWGHEWAVIRGQIVAEE